MVHRFLLILAIFPLLCFVFAGCSRDSGLVEIAVEDSREGMRSYGIPLAPGWSEYPGGEVLKGELLRPSTISLSYDRASFEGELIFRRNGNLLKGTLAEPTSLRFIPDTDKRILFKAQVLLREGCYVAWGTLGGDCTFLLGNTRRRFLLPEETEVWFDEAGRLSSFRLSATARGLVSPEDSSSILAKLRYCVSLDGRITRCGL